MFSFKQYIDSQKAIIGMIHVPALPGTPKSQTSPEEIIRLAVNEARQYEQAGVLAVMIENMHDLPYTKGYVGHEISTLMSIIGYEIKKATKLYCGIQLLAAANKEALAAAHSSGLDFIRAEGFVFGHLADEGLIESSAAELLRYRKLIGAESVMVFTDIKKKHSSHAISSDTPIAEHAHAAEFFLSDGLIVTGQSTGLEADLQELNMVKEATDLPLFIGSGITAQNIDKFYAYADGFIIGSYFKKNGQWQNAPDKKRILALLNAINLSSM
jgi:uncharacterized protein